MTRAENEPTASINELWSYKPKKAASRDMGRAYTFEFWSFIYGLTSPLPSASSLGPMPIGLKFASDEFHNRPIYFKMRVHGY